MSIGNRQSAIGNHRPGLTLVELLLALASTGLIATAVGAMLVSVSYGTSSRQDMRSLVVKSKTLASRLDAALRSSRMVLASDDVAIVLWTSDSRDDDFPNLSELRLIEHDAEAGEIRSYMVSFDPDLSEEDLEAADTAYELTADFLALVDQLKEGDSFPATIWATGVSAWQLGFNADDVQLASLVSYRLDLTTGTLDNQSIGAAALRNR